MAARRPCHAALLLLAATLAAACCGPACAASAPAAAPSPPPSQSPPPASELVALASPLGQALLYTSWQSADYGPLAQTFLTQDNLAYCGVASSVMVLNSLPVPAPHSAQYTAGDVSYAFWTQTNLFDSNKTRAAITPEQVKSGGMTLAQLAALLNTAAGVEATATYASALTLADFRTALVTGAASPGDRLLINYNRPAVGQAGGGHISPVAAYSKLTDRVLVMDVARYRYPASWVAVQDLYRAAQAVDSSSGKSRGIVRITVKGSADSSGQAGAAPAEQGPAGSIHSLVESLLGRR